MKLRFTRALVGLLLLIGLSTFAYGDNVYATIRGTATDPTGAVLPGVKVTAANTATGQTFSVTSRQNGEYQFLQLPVGPYVVTATKDQFKTFKTSAITLVLNQVYELPIKLDVGSMNETVEVNANAVQVETTNTQLQTIVESKKITDLPLIGRNWTQLEQLAPGVQSSSDRFGTYSVSGSQSNQSSYLINGLDSNDLPLNTPLIVPSADAIQEFNLITNTINPEYGRNSGAIVNAVIKNGTNQYHGDVFDFYRDSFLNNKNFFQKTAPKYHQNMFGATFGGPIIKDRTFFFVSYQGIRAVQPQAGGNVKVFSAAQRNNGDFTGDFADTTPNNANGQYANWFSDPANSGVCPMGSRVAPNGQTYCSQYFNPTAPNAYGTLGTVIVPTANFNPLAVALMTKYVPLPNVGSNYQFNPQLKQFANQYILRLDHALSQQDALWGVLFYQRSPSSQDLPFTGASLAGFGEVDTRYQYQYNVDWTHTFSGTTLNELRAGWTYFNFGAVNPQTPALPSSFGFTGINPQDTAGAGMPYVGVTGYFGLGFSTNGPQPRDDQTYELTDNFSHIVGHHTLKFGFDGRRFSVDNPFYGRNNGSFSFSTSGKYSSGDPAMNYLLGVPSSYGQGAGGLINARAYEVYLYAQDSWKIRDNVTLNYGTGWQVDTPLNNNQFNGEAINCFIPGQQSTIFPTAPVGLDFPGDPGCTKSGTTTHWGHFGPRIGIAWAPNLGWISGGNSNKFSVRAGWGIFYNRSEEEGSLQNLGAPPYGVNSSGVADVGGSPAFANPWMNIATGTSIPNKFPYTNFPKPGDPIDFSQFYPMQLNVTDPKYDVPYAQNFNLTIQREFPSDMVLSVGYVGSVGRNLIRAYEGNPISLAAAQACLADPTCSGGDYVYQHIYYPNHSPLAPGDIFATAGTQHTDGISNYNSLQVSLKKGTTHGLNFQLSYTYSHALDNASGLESSGFGLRGTNPYPQYAYLNYGNSGYDARHRLVVSYVYQVPNLHNHVSWAPSALFKGWMFSGITTLQSGFPLTIGDSGFTSLTCDAYTYYACPDVPNYNGNLQYQNTRAYNAAGQGYYYFNSAAFTPAALGSFGNAARNFFHGPGINNTDFVIEKDTYIGSSETRFVAMRLEAYNLFNHTQFLGSGIDTDVQSGTFGQAFSAAAGRQVQLALKFYF